MSDTTSALRRMVDDIAHDLRQLANGMPVADIDCDGDDSPVLCWLDDQLEVQVIRRHTLGTLPEEADVIEWRILCGFGGPNLWVHVSSNGDCEVRGFWGSDEMTAHARCLELAQVLDHLTWAMS